MVTARFPPDEGVNGISVLLTASAVGMASIIVARVVKSYVFRFPRRVRVGTSTNSNSVNVSNEFVKFFVLFFDRCSIT